MTALSGSYSTSTGSLARDRATDNSVQHETQRRRTNRILLHINHCGYTIFALLHLMAFLRVLLFPDRISGVVFRVLLLWGNGTSQERDVSLYLLSEAIEKMKRRWISDVGPNERAGEEEQGFPTTRGLLSIYSGLFSTSFDIPEVKGRFDLPHDPPSPHRLGEGFFLVVSFLSHLLGLSRLT